MGRRFLHVLMRSLRGNLPRRSASARIAALAMRKLCARAYSSTA
ncbi:hypothetical protein OH736_45735 (plasmid) [Streptomyces sp. NBC_01650]|nr:hypothetical protein OH736_45735 [Streptomyces sp. NBC_01650]